MFSRRLLTLLIAVMLIFVLVKTNDSAFSQVYNSKMDNMKLEFNNVNFQKSFFNKLLINLTNADFTNGTIDNVIVNSFGFQKKDLLIDEVDIALKGLALNTDSLFTKQMLVLSKPVEALGTIIITEKSINSILNQPQVLDKLKNIVQMPKTLPGLPNGMVSLVDPRASIVSNNRLQLDMKASIANIIRIPVCFSANLSLINNKLLFTDPKISSSGLVLPNEVTNMVNNKLNDIINIDDKFNNNDIAVKITSLQMLPGQKITVNGKALISKLNLGKKIKP